jgi:glyoxylase-like metal-dependent hydrolase (beta-lactamase superfamily II)
MTHTTLVRLAAVPLLLAGIAPAPAHAESSAAPAGAKIPPIGAPNPKYLDVPPSAKGPAIDPAKGYRIQELGRGLYMITDNIYQSMFLVYDRGVVVIDVPPDYAAKLPRAIAEVTKHPVTHVVYSHSHTDHIGGTKSLAHEETRRLLERAADPRRPLPTVTFSDRHTLRVGDQTLELSYHGDAHEPGNIFIHAPTQQVLMVVDVVFPGWMPWRRFAVAHDVPGHLAQVEEIRNIDWQTFVGGHVARTGTRADVELQAEFYRDLKEAAAKALASTKPGVGLDPSDQSNPWAVFDNFIDRVATACVDALMPKWATRLAAFDVCIWDQCYAMEQSLRID